MNNEPVAWMCQDNVTDEWEFSSMKYCNKCEPLYTHPADLTNEEILEIRHKYRTKLVDGNYRVDELEFARAILKKASEK